MKKFFAVLVAAVIMIVASFATVMAQTLDTESKSVGGFAVVGALDANTGYNLNQLGAMGGAILVVDEVVEFSLSYGKFMVGQENRIMAADSSAAIRKVMVTELRAGVRIPVWEIFSMPIGVGIARLRERDVQYDLIGYAGILASVSQDYWHIDLGIHNAWYPDRHGREGGKYPPRNTMAFVGIRRDLGD